jgi:hypothetical protein
MNLFALIPAGILICLAVYLSINRPLWLLGGYLVLVPLCPPLPAGPIELSMLDLLAIPAIIRIIYNLSRSGFEIKGGIVKGMFLIVFAAVLSYISFSFQTQILSAGMMFRVIRLIEMFLPVILAYQTLREYPTHKIIRLFLIGSGLTAAVAVFMFMNGISLRESQTFIEDGFEIFRAGGTHGDSGSLGSFMGVSVLVAIWTLLYYNRHGLAKWAFISGGLSGLALLMTLSRGGLVLAALGTLILMIPLLKQPGRLIKVAFVSVLLVVAGSFIAVKYINHDLITMAASEFGQRVTGLSELSTDFETVSSHRTIHWEQGLNLYKGSALAWPFGLGYKSLKLHYDTLPDNNFNQALFEMGIFGVCALLILIGSGMRDGIIQYRFNKHFGILILALWIALISNMVSADVLTYWHNIPAIFILLIAVGMKAQRISHSGRYALQG